jgi:D-beta-D-heptose 7-phosphate kinase / D-beta-D-heptose 1-phosphate adenosyltransferase
MTLAAFDRLAASDAATPKRLAVVGDSMLDRWIFGRVHECQDGCPCFRVDYEVQLPGGAANAARQLIGWASQAFLVAPWPKGRATGVDLSLSFGEEFNLSYLPIKTRYVADGRILFRRDQEPNCYGSDGKSLRACHLMIMATLRDGAFDAVVLCDYQKGFLDDELIRSVIAFCNKRRIPVVADAKRAPEVFAGAVLKVNADYARRHRDVGFRPHTVVTHGALPPLVVHDGIPHMANPAPDIQSAGPVQHVGAGDCFAAHLALGLAHGLPLRDAAAIAHAAGRVYVSRPLAQPPRPSEIRAVLSS